MVNTPPTLHAYRTPGGLRVFCPACRRWHRHSARGGHRVAHCTSDASPYAVSGYVLVVDEREATG
jgi:hypothetical protein